MPNTHAGTRVDFIYGDERLPTFCPVYCNAVEDVIQHHQHTDGLKLLAKVENVITDKAAVYVHIGRLGKSVQTAVCKKLDGKGDFLCFRLAFSAAKGAETPATHRAYDIFFGSYVKFPASSSSIRYRVTTTIHTHSLMVGIITGYSWL